MEGRSSDLQNCHEAYQVLLKVMRAKNNFMKKAVAKREKQIKIMGQVEGIFNLETLELFDYH